MPVKRGRGGEREMGGEEGGKGGEPPIHIPGYATGFADPDFLLECKISAIWRRFPLIFAFYMLNARHISTSGLFDLLN